MDKTKAAKLLLIGFLFILLILLRGFYSKFLYDPFILFFKNGFLDESFPTINKLKYFGTIVFRYLINTFISLLILHIYFKSKPVLKQAIKVYLVFFIILNVLFFVELSFNLSNTYLVLFYVRRFLIHPLLLLVLLPAFYYQKLLKKEA